VGSSISFSNFHAGGKNQGLYEQLDGKFFAQDKKEQDQAGVEWKYASMAKACARVSG